MSFGERLTELRKQNGYATRHEFAEKLKIPTTTLRNYEIDTRTPPFDFLIQISELFDVSVDYLLGTTDIKDRSFSLQFDDSEIELLKRYRSLNDHDKKLIYNVVVLCKELNQSQLDNPVDSNKTLSEVKSFNNVLGQIIKKKHESEDDKNAI